MQRELALGRRYLPEEFVRTWRGSCDRECTISDCYLTGGFALGTMLDGTFRRTDNNAGQPTGRIKCGTESNGGFRNITVSNCIFESCRGFALESVDGGPVEDIIFTGITMRDIPISAMRPSF